MLGDLGLGQAEGADQVVHRPLAAGQDIEDLPPPGLGDGVEGVGGGGGARHGTNIC